jgi:hypothetical protein
MVAIRPGLLVCFSGSWLLPVMERCRDFADPAFRPVSVGMSEDPYVATLGALDGAFGLSRSARLKLSEALSEARRLGHAHTLALVLSFANWHDQLTSSPKLKGHAEELLTVSNEHGFPWFSNLALISDGPRVRPGARRAPNRLSPSGNSFCVARPLD